MTTTKQGYLFNRIAPADVAGYPEDSMLYVNYLHSCNNNPFAVTGIAYLWESNPMETMLGAPIYSADEYRLPAAPWQFQVRF